MKISGVNSQNFLGEGYSSSIVSLYLFHQSIHQGFEGDLSISFWYNLSISCSVRSWALLNKWSRVTFEFDGSSPRIPDIIGSHLGLFGSRPRATAVMGSSLGSFGSMPKGASNMGSRAAWGPVQCSPGNEAVHHSLAQVSDCFQDWSSKDLWHLYLVHLATLAPLGRAD